MTLLVFYMSYFKKNINNKYTILIVLTYINMCIYVFSQIVTNYVFTIYFFVLQIKK